MTIQKTKTVNLARDAINGGGTVAAISGVVLAFATAGSVGGLTVTLTLRIGGLLKVIIGYLKRIALALTKLVAISNAHILAL
ncbi:hypothetical protein [Arthrobacter glacialis]|uniref:hypothetical protein n=1 Tax=Arthrobacter glacialis TaxID=1664 RepID=UPI000CD422AF|nr:hypothetical protein [Arthrobacter glacialis]POH57107.1 hypothetical protein CVS28_17040 [Arthrobacter glacialis]